jgi:hypothetical protein
MNILIKNLLKKFIFPKANHIQDSDVRYVTWITSLYLKLENVPGHIAEIGVASGRNAILFGQLIKLFGDSEIRQYIGFDTFMGYTDQDLKKDGFLNPERWKGDEFSLSSVKRRCERADVSLEVDFIKGDVRSSVSETLTSFEAKRFYAGKGKFALLYIDCNAFEPAFEAMHQFWDYLVPGAIIAIDEKIQAGETEAMLKFAAEKNLKIYKPNNPSVPMYVTVKNES